MELNERVVKLEVQGNELRKDVEAIKEQVTNHIPSAIADVKTVVDDLRDKHIAEAAVSNAWSNNFKKTAIVVAIVFTIVRIMELIVALAK